MHNLAWSIIVLGLAAAGGRPAAAQTILAPAGPVAPAGPATPAAGPAGTNAAPGLVAAPAGTDSATNQFEQELKLGYDALQSSQTNAAVALFKKVLARDPKNKRARFGLATAMIQMDRYKEAIALLDSLIAEHPKDYFLKNNLAWILATAHDPAIRDGRRAVRLSQEALLSAPNDSHVWSTLAEAYYLCGNYDKALRSAEQALMLSRETQMDPRLVRDYEQQVDRCRKAAEAMSILE